MTPLRDVARAQRLVECGVITERKSCLAKCSYADRNLAIHAAKRIANKTGRKTETYKCNWCRGFHITKLRHGEDDREQGQ